YHIGWPASQKLDVTGDKPETVTGGAEQENPCHVVELMAACAAYDFFTAENINEKEATYYYRNVEADDNHVLQLTGKSFMGDDGDKFENKLGAFFSFAHIVLSTYGGAQEMAGTDQFIRIFGDQKIHDYDTIPESQTKEIDEYMKKFAYNIVKGNIRKGWIYQIKDSLGAGSFIFKSEAFKSSPNELRSIDPGNIFTNEQHNWDKSMLKSRYDKFIGGLISPNAYPMDDQNVNTTKERFMAHIYNAITIAQHYDS
ncbi:MAG: hypothetical protein K2M76_01100, partial [Muribaculaceae bacterium]|nr:hypothetical protein [Muribaculaceae bacterium]